MWVDARSDEAFAKGHIPGAVHLTMEGWALQFLQFTNEWRPNWSVIVYCDGGTCHASQEVAEHLQKSIKGIDVSILKGGYPAWLRR